jgi:hypothetical protein
MDQQTIDKQTQLYLYDLMNLAKEHGFKADDNWEFSLASDAERVKIQKDYYPTNATKIFPEIGLQVMHGVKAQLKQSFTKEEQALDNRSVIAGELNYLVAYNLKRPRT